MVSILCLRSPQQYQTQADVEAAHPQAHAVVPVPGGWRVFLSAEALRDWLEDVDAPVGEQLTDPDFC